MTSAHENPPSPRIVVCGSINMDLVVRCQEIPKPGQTIKAESASEICGGKGANQAVAAAKVGGRVQMIGRVGSDAFAERLRTNLEKHDVDCRAVLPTDDCTSGLAIIALERSGQNAIMVIPGANGKLSETDVQDHRQLIESADVLMLQLEIPTPSVMAAIRIAKRCGVRCILDPAPVAADWTDELLDVDLVCPNESEAAAITGIEIKSLEDAQSAALQLQARGAKNVAVTMGEKGTVLLAAESFHHVAPTPIQPVDTTAAGDAFAGAVAVEWAKTSDLLQSTRFANIAGALAATKLGAQQSLANRNEINAIRNQTCKE
ncbi:ribokinase [Aporhodopirellula aestuarii]|uniref:Ribokinase n=1 Tax=Aporhodopirellula aestuarii TaxID=2950107 RepID=A0ABT0TY20_9BACT|nr:ribokinase [Aporhodopirellula aestuarii]MCM2369470.1 ribokinase [Aporhodopirellula aestuarii]